eukprot:TRINITY_DN64_c0_g1_i8.p3 TRINITY_DN64_c0_g1~~TRINITY_DN64_c0_g1_i8.p3  ORF type:complete len:234 (-),score=57.82 TRINITY_DN64_c0_g1_i8:1210-1911(-)
MMKVFMALFIILSLLSPIIGQEFDSTNVDSTFDNLVEEEVGPDGTIDLGGGDAADEEAYNGDDGRNSFGNFYGVTGPAPSDPPAEAPGDGADNAQGGGRGVSVAQDVQRLFSDDLGEVSDETYYEYIVGAAAQNVNPGSDNENPTIGSIYEEGVEEGNIQRGQGNQRGRVFRGGNDVESVFTNNGQGNIGRGPGTGVGDGQFLSGALDSVEDSEGFEGVADEEAIDDALAGYR